MNLGYSAVMPVVIPLSTVAAGFILGVIIEKVILARIMRIAARTRWKADDVIIGSLHNLVILWCVIAGVFIALNNLQPGAAILQPVKKTLLIMVIFSVTVAVSRTLVGLIRVYTASVSDVLPSATIFTNLTRMVVYILGLLIMLDALGISISPILTALGVGGLAVALALQDTLSNLFSGLQILISRQMKPGDYIRLDSGEEGYVADITWRNTTIRALPNNMIVVPNTKLASSTIVTNFYMPEREMAVLVQVGVSYDSDLYRVERATIETAREVMKEVPGGVPEFEPFIRYHTFADFSINFSVIMRAREVVDQHLIKHEFVKRLHMRYREEGIEIPFPIRTVHMK